MKPSLRAIVKSLTIAPNKVCHVGGFHGIAVEWLTVLHICLNSSGEGETGVCTAMDPSSTTARPHNVKAIDWTCVSASRPTLRALEIGHPSSSV